MLVAQRENKNQPNRMPNYPLNDHKNLSKDQLPDQ